MQELRIKVDTNEKIITLIDDYKVVEKYIETADESIEGNIYIGVVKNIIPGIKAAFVDIGQEKNAFIHFEDIYKTNNEIKLNEKILVQVQKDEINQKGAKLTTNIKLTGRQIVLLPTTDIITVSRKIENEKVKEKLIEIVAENLPKGVGAIIRTTASKATKTEIIDDIQRLVKDWNNIEKKVQNSDEAPVLLGKNNTIIESVILGTADSGMDKIITDSKEENKKIEKFLKEFELDDKVKVEYDEKVLDKYKIKDELEKLNNNKIWLKCGSYIVIDKTEALTSIDVNSGKYTGKENLENTILRVNEEATVEIAKQIRLRDMSGIIIIDYIDMELEENKHRIMKLLEQEVKKDRAKVQIEGFTRLNLLEMTRKQLYGKSE